MCRTVTIRAKEKENQEGQELRSTTRSHETTTIVALTRPWIWVSGGARPTLPVSRGCKPQPSFLRFGVASWKARCCATQDGKGDLTWPTKESAKKKQRKTVCHIVYPQHERLGA